MLRKEEYVEGMVPRPRSSVAMKDVQTMPRKDWGHGANKMTLNCFTMEPSLKGSDTFECLDCIHPCILQDR